MQQMEPEKWKCVIVNTILPRGRAGRGDPQKMKWRSIMQKTDKMIEISQTFAYWWWEVAYSDFLSGTGLAFRSRH